MHFQPRKRCEAFRVITIRTGFRLVRNRHRAIPWEGDALWNIYTISARWITSCSALLRSSWCGTWLNTVCVIDRP